MNKSCYSKSGVTGGFYSLLHVMKQNRKKLHTMAHLHEK